MIGESSFTVTPGQGATTAPDPDDIYTYSASWLNGPWGEVNNTSGFPFRFTGRRYDAETGIYYYRARYYSSALGRFLQTDPVGYGDNMNMYAYVANDSVNARDPSGNFSVMQNPGCFHMDPTACGDEPFPGGGGGSGSGSGSGFFSDDNSNCENPSNCFGLQELSTEDARQFAIDSGLAIGSSEFTGPFIGNKSDSFGTPIQAGLVGTRLLPSYTFVLRNGELERNEVSVSVNRQGFLARMFGGKGFNLGVFTLGGAKFAPTIINDSTVLSAHFHTSTSFRPSKRDLVLIRRAGIAGLITNAQGQVSLFGFRNGQAIYGLIVP